MPSPGSEPGIQVVAATDGVGAVAAMLRHRVDVVLLDLHMPGADGLQVLDGVRLLEAPPVAVLAARIDQALAAGTRRASSCGASTCRIDPDRALLDHATPGGARPEGAR